jgi:hypothetical protein
MILPSNADWIKIDPVQFAVQSGWSIIPIGSDKRPFNGMSWKAFQEYPADVEQIEHWRKLNPPAWAIITGAVSRIVILDFDGIDGACLMHMSRLRPHVKTPSGGYHVWIEHPGWPVKTLNSKSDKKRLGEIYPGLDIRADGGYALFAGKTAHGTYQRLRPMQPDPLTAVPQRMRAVLGILEPPRAEITPPPRANLVCTPTTGQLADALIRKALDVAVSEGRNNGGFWLAIQARDNGFTIADDSIMREYQRSVGSRNKKGVFEPFGEYEAIAVWRSAFARAAREPWGAR